MRILTISDIHVDFADNRDWVRGLSDADYVRDTLLLAGDVSHDLGLLESTLAVLVRKFRQVFFVPGNHDLWNAGKGRPDSLEKFRRILDRCSALGVKTLPAKVRAGSGDVVVVPLFSWYTTPEEGDDTLYLDKEGEDPSLEIWSDTHFVVWPNLAEHTTPASYFLRLNQRRLAESPYLRAAGTPVVSFSHFLPRTDLMLDTAEEEAAAGRRMNDPNPAFNFSRVAGSRGLEAQIRALGSAVHVYGHQHRNRDRTVDGVRYVSHCLGYGYERSAGLVRDFGSEPKVIWD